MSRSLQVFCALMLVGVFCLTILMIRSKHDRRQEEPAESPELANLRNELQAEQTRRREYELARSNAVGDATELRRKLSLLESEKGQAEQTAREREAYRQQVVALEQQLAIAPVSSAGGAASPVRSNPGAEEGLQEKERIEAFLCATHLQQIGLAAGQWADVHDDAAPPDFLSLKDYLAPMIFVCPSATPKTLSLSWKDFDPATISYRYRLGGFPNEWRWRKGSTRIFADCPIHGTLVYTSDSRHIGSMPICAIRCGAPADRLGRATMDDRQNRQVCHQGDRGLTPGSCHGIWLLSVFPGGG